MKIYIGSDHAGFLLKQNLIPRLKATYEVIDLGVNSPEPSDYPVISAKLARAVLASSTDTNHTRGILICGSGIGASIAANKIRGARAGVCGDTYSAHQGVEHDDMNILVLGSRVIAEELAFDICKIFLDARFDGVERHARRVKEITTLEEEGAQHGTP